MIDQIMVAGKGDQGADEIMFVSEPVNGKIRVILPAQSIYIDKEVYKELMLELFPMTGAKHAGTL